MGLHCFPRALHLHETQGERGPVCAMLEHEEVRDAGLFRVDASVRVPLQKGLQSLWLKGRQQGLDQGFSWLDQPLGRQSLQEGLEWHGGVERSQRLDV